MKTTHTLTVLAGALLLFTACGRVDAAEAKQAAEAIFALETRFAEVHWDSVTNRDPEKIYNPYPVDAINYGAVGGVIGHEISHGFDDKGSKFDGDGNLKNWWTEEDRAAFEARTAALVEQFEQFEPVPGMHINGELTLGENIGDLSGVAMAYRAYIRSLGGKEPPVLDGFTGPQRFFIGYAMSGKRKYRTEAMVSRLTADPHSPLKYRVIGPYRNIDAFHATFGTAEGDGMWLPPEERVRIW